MATLKQRSAAADKRRALEGRFDPEVIARMREEFDAADTDGSGEVDVHECAAMLGKLDGGRQSKAELQKSGALTLELGDDALVSSGRPRRQSAGAGGWGACTSSSSAMKWISGPSNPRCPSCMPTIAGRPISDICHTIENQDTNVGKFGLPS